MSQQENSEEITNFEELVLIEETPEQKALNEAYVKIYEELGIFDKYKTPV
jgi:hypothetical protein